MKRKQEEMGEVEEEEGVEAKRRGVRRICSYDLCPICLTPLASFTTLATPNTCEHIFCLDCLEEWSNNVNTCPSDRLVFSEVLVRSAATFEIIRRVPKQDRVEQRRAEYEQDLTFCERCRMSDREDRMLLCDGCDRGFHCECLDPPLDFIPEGDWYCERCAERRGIVPSSPTEQQPRRRVMARTNFSERVRRQVNANRGIIPTTSSASSSSSSSSTASRSFVARASSTTTKRRVVRRKVTKKRRRRRVVKKKASKKKPTTLNKALKAASASKTGTKSTGVITRRKRKTKRRKKRRSTVKSAATQRRSYSLFKKKIRLTDKTAKERIIKRILEGDEEQKTSTDAGSVRIVSHDHNHFNDQLMDMDNRDFVSVGYVDSKQTRVEPTPNAIKKVSSSTPGPDLLSSLLDNQKLLYVRSSQVQIQIDGKISMVEPEASSNKAKSFSLPPKPTTKRPSFVSDASSSKPSITSKDLKPPTKEPHNNLAENKSPEIPIKIKSDPDTIKSEPLESKKDTFTIKNEPLVQDKVIKIEKKTHRPDVNSTSSKIDNKQLIQDRVASVAKEFLRPLYLSGQVNKEEYKYIMKKVVNKCLDKVTDVSQINNDKVNHLTSSYVKRVKSEGIK